MAEKFRILWLACVALALGGSPAWAAIAYGDLEFIVEREPKGEPLHGYTEFRVLVRNRGEATRRVTLVMPGQNYSARGRGALQGISRTVEVGPELTVPISLLQPSHPDVLGTGITVYIDGRRDEKLLPLTPSGSRGGSWAMYGYGRPMRRGMSYGYGGPGGNEPLALVSQRVPENFFNKPAPPVLPPGLGGAAPGAGGPAFGGGMGGPGGGFTSGVMLQLNAQLARADMPISAWSSRWLGYTRYDGVVVAREDLEELQNGTNETRAVLRALWQFTEAGGILLVLGPGRVDVPAGWQRQSARRAGMTIYQVGFGQCLITPDRDKDKWDSMPESRWLVIGAAMNQTVSPFTSSRGLFELNTSFPVVDDLGVPVKGLFVLMILFAIALGPVNLVILGRKNKRIWMLWTVPALSLCTCVMVFGYMIVAEGWQGHARVGGITLLNEIDRRATSLGRTAFYSPLTPGDGLRFSEDTEVQVQGADRDAFISSCTVDWTQGQHLARGWVTARVPAHFTLRKSEVRRERLNIQREPDGTLRVLNALGADIKTLWLADEKGVLYNADSIAAGERATLTRSEGKLAKGRPMDAWRRIYGNSDWPNAAHEAAKRPHETLGPGTYIAVVDGSPFLEQGLRGARVRPSQSVVLGVLADVGAKP